MDSIVTSFLWQFFLSIKSFSLAGEYFIHLGNESSHLAYDFFKMHSPIGVFFFYKIEFKLGFEFKLESW